MFKEIKSKQTYQRDISQDNNDEDQKQQVLVLPYKGHKAEKVVNSIRQWLNVVLPRNAKIKTFYAGKRLSFCFKTKDKVKFDHENDLIHHVNCP